MSYSRFLTDKDYDSLATGSQMQQLIRDVADRLPQAEQRAEMNFLEHLDQYYEIEKVLAVGKNIKDYSPYISYPGLTWLKKDETIFKTLKPINGYKIPTTKQYWKQVVEFIDPCLIEHAKKYSQLRTYAKGEVVRFGTEYWICLIPHGYETNDIHIPGINAWVEVEATPWGPFMEWKKNEVCEYNGNFYQYLLDPVEEEEPDQEEENNGAGQTDPNGNEPSQDPSQEPNQDPNQEPDPDPTNTGNQGQGNDPTGNDPQGEEEEILTPETDEAWGLIGEYSQDYEYDYSEDVRDYVVADGVVFYPVMNPNADSLEIGLNITRDDPRNQNVVGHMARIALYYLHQIISPTNISETRRWAYEDSMQWLHDASRFKINPQIPRKRDRETGEKKVDWALATFQKNYDPNENAWLI